MNFKLFVGHQPVAITKTVFPGGESCIRIEGNGWEPFQQNAKITMDFKSNSDMFDLALLVDAVRHHYGPDTNIALDMPYLPYARQDRVCNKGESLSVKVVATLINSLNFTRVYCQDIHSNVGEALINNLTHIKLASCANDVVKFCKPEMTALVSPDAGAEKKVFDFAKEVGYTSIIRASKVRNVATGKIERTTIIDEISMQDMLIVDDICDGGRTFIELAKAIRAEDFGNEGQKINLYVTHGIFSAGLEVFEGFIDKIYVHNLMNDVYNDHPLIQII